MEINGNNSRQSYNKRSQITNTSRKNATHSGTHSKIIPPCK